MSELVWVGSKMDHQSHYHVTEKCFRLRGVLKRTPGTTLITIDITALHNTVEPCSRCYPDRVQPDTFKPYCRICVTRRACRHNGGVPVKTGSGMNWVWPERAHLYARLAVAE